MAITLVGLVVRVKPWATADVQLNLGFFVDSMASAAWTKLFNGEFLGLALLVLAGDIVAPFAAITLKPDKIPHFLSPFSEYIHPG